MPPATRAILITNISVFLLQPAGGEGFAERFALWPPGSSDPGFGLWHLVTYSFLHGGLAHIIFNMYALYMFGGDIERLFGSLFFLAYYFVCVICAGLFRLMVSSLVGGPGYPVIGASGAVYGVLLAFGISFPRRIVILIIPPIPMQARTFVVVVGLMELVFGVTGTEAGIAHFAHLGGMFGGWLMLKYHSGRFPFSGPD